MERKEIYKCLNNTSKHCVCELAAGILDILINCQYEDGLNDYSDGWNDSRKSVLRLFSFELKNLHIL